ncbi:MAG: hypothetical protein IAE91_09345 [Ignavibacteriaceae bacterium]|nr:hypothetical protein [Ignavibacteriaceae bacterium]
MKNQIIEAWLTNNRINLMLLDAIPDEGLECTLSKRGGRTVKLQFSHLHNVRLYRLQNYAKNFLNGLTEIDKDINFEREFLKSNLENSANAISDWVSYSIDNEECIKGFKKGAFNMIAYFIAHEAHHRGNILLTLKQSGVKISQEIKYGIWDWNKI